MASRACVLATILCALSASARECINLTLPQEKHSIFNETFYNRTLFTIQSNGPHFVASGGRNIIEMWDRFPKVVVPVNGTTEQCRRDSQLYLDSLDRLEMWALKIFDSTAKLPSGILQGNGNQYGDFDQCLSVDGAVRGKYCLASLEVTLAGSEELDKIDFLVHSGHYLKSNLTDMGHRVPRFSSLLWGVCIPSSCSSYDLEEELTSRLREFNIKVKVHNTMCTVKNTKRPYSFAKTLSITFFLAMLLLLSLGTILDDGAEATTNFEKLLNAFSLKRNFRKLFDLSGGERLKGLDCIRGLNALALLGAHKSMAMAHNNYVNKARLAEVFGMHWAVLGRSAILYTDSFLYLSGFLNAHNLLKELERKDTIDVKNKLVSRWFRLFPLFLSLMLFCTYILPDVNSGPQWNLVVEEHSRVCQKNMWKSFLFIHNWFGFEDMCLTHTHQIGIDIQLYVATIPLMLLLWKRKTLGWSAVVTIAVVSTVLRYMAVYWHDISMVVYYGISVQKLLDAARFCYILPTHRATIYLIGVAMAYYFKHNKHTNRLTEVQAITFWIFTLSFGIILLAWPYEMGLPTYEYSHGPSANFAAFSPILWGIFVSIVHWGLANDYALFGTSFVNSRFFKFFNKIAYGVYLTQFPIFFYNVGIQRAAEFYSPLHLFHLPETLCIFVISTLTTVAIEMPFNEVHRIYFGNTQTKVKNKVN